MFRKATYSRSRASLGIQGSGLGLRRELVAAFKAERPGAIDFLEIAPENWMDAGGRHKRDLDYFAERYPLVCHGLSLSLGGPTALDESFLQRLKTFLDRYRAPLYSEHLSYCSDDGQLYDLLPIPFTEDAVYYVAARIRRAQDILERQIAIENASFYVAPSINEMSERQFIVAVLQEADCLLHLDVNNAYVNSVNHRYDAAEFIRGMPAERIVYLHVAGHYNQADDLLVDTHGADVVDPVWELLSFTYETFGVHPTLLERDFNIPPLCALVREVEKIARLQARHDARIAC